MSRQLSLDFGTTPDSASETSGSMLGQRMLYQSQSGQLYYELVRSKRRSIGLQIQDHGLRITAPHWVSLSQIEEAIEARFNWITQKLQLVQQRQQLQQQNQQRWQFDGQIPFLGQAIILRQGVQPEQPHPGKIWFDGDNQSDQSSGHLWLPLPNDADSRRIQEMTQAWLQQQAIVWFGRRLQYFEARQAPMPSSWRLSNARTRWGSCSSQKRINLNWRLIHFELPVIDYVIAHELAHLKEMNHSPAFWKTLQTIYPDYLQGHQKLKAYRPGDLPTV